MCRWGDRFGFDPELVIQFAKRHARFIEVPIDYRGRTPEQGEKKIRADDTIDAFGTLLRTWSLACLQRRRRTDSGDDVRAKRFNQWIADTITPFVKGEVWSWVPGLAI